MPYTAQMGFPGFAQFVINGANYPIRAKSCDVKLIQQIEKPNVIDPSFDRYVFQAKPSYVEGNVEYPVIMDYLDPTELLYSMAAYKDNNGRLPTFDLFVAYQAGSGGGSTSVGTVVSGIAGGFRYQTCSINSFKFSVAQMGTIDIAIGIVGYKRLTAFFPSPISQAERIATWNDAFVNFTFNNGSQITFLSNNSAEIRNFEVSINNNTTKFFTGTGNNYPQDINSTIRDITGLLTIMGRDTQLASFAEANQTRCISDASINFGYRTVCGQHFNGIIPNVVFEIEEMSLTNELFETRVKYHSLPADNFTSSLMSMLA